MRNFLKMYVLFIVFFMVNIPGYVFADDFFKKTKINNIYNGEIVLPDDYKQDKSEGTIRDNLYKMVDIQLNFAGKYSIVRHSCGAGCMYITLIDLSSGNEDYDIFSKFSLSEANSFQINDEKYITYPVSVKESYGVIMKYIPDIDGKPCYEQKFILKNNKLVEYSKMYEIKCEKY